MRPPAMMNPGRAMSAMTVGIAVLILGGGIAIGQSPPPEQRLCVTVTGPAPSDGWTPASLTSAITAGSVTVGVVGPESMCAPVPSPSLVASASPVVSPSPMPSPDGPTAPSARWGPMAVIHDPATQGLDAGLGPVRLVITDECVLVRGSRGPATTIVWRDGQTRWKADGRIVFRNLDGTRVVLRDGDQVTLGGYSPTDIGGIPPLAPWIVRPNASCPAEQWQAHEVRLVR